MRVRNRGGLMLVTTAGAFVAFSLMTIAVGTDYWLYSPGVCRTSAGDNETSPKNEEVLTHSGLWRQCCMEGMFTGVCKNFNHFPEDAEYEQDAAEYLLRAARASSLFPIMSAGLLFVGGVCVVCVVCIAASEFYTRCHNIILSSGIFFVSSGLSNIIGIIVYISANANDPNQSESKRSHWYGWSFYCAALSFIIAETVGGLAVHLFIETHRARRTHTQLSLQPYTLTRLQRRHSFGYCSRCSSRHAQSCPFYPPTRDRSPSLHGNDLALYPLGQGFMPPTLPRDFHNMIIANNLSSTHMQRLQNFVKSDNGFPPNLILKPEEKGVDIFDAHVNSSVKVDSGPVVSQHMFKSVIDGELVKEHSFSPLSGSTTRRTTPV